MKLPESHLFTDSAIVLAWIKNNGKRVKPFVASKVNEIRSNVKPVQWRHIPSEQNVADDISRGLSVPELSERWSHAPEFLWRPKREWPMEDAQADAAAIQRECKTQTVGMISN